MLMDGRIGSRSLGQFDEASSGLFLSMGFQRRSCVHFSLKLEMLSKILRYDLMGSRFDDWLGIIFGHSSIPEKQHDVARGHFRREFSSL